MNGQQVERLKRDARELEYFKRRLQLRGNHTKAYNMQKKCDYLNSRIEELEEILYQN